MRELVCGYGDVGRAWPLWTHVQVSVHGAFTGVHIFLCEDGQCYILATRPSYPAVTCSVSASPEELGNLIGVRDELRKSFRMQRCAGSAGRYTLVRQATEAVGSIPTFSTWR